MLVGDIILIQNKSPGSLATRLGQSALRVIFDGRFGVARYSHVMLGVGHSQVIHADGRITQYDALIDVAAGMPISVRRRTAPPLTEEQQQTLLHAANRYSLQPYSFFVGRRSSSLGRALHRGKQTRPFCSELVVAAYEAIGVDLCNLPPDRVLPLHLDKACRSPEWEEVTDSYFERDFEPDMHPAIDGMREWWHGASQTLWNNARIAARLQNMKASSFRQILAPMETFRKIRDLDLALALQASAAPAALFAEHQYIQQRLHGLEATYAQIEDGFASLASWSAEDMRGLYGDAPDQTPYEGLPGLPDIASAEEAVNMAAFASEVVRGEAVLAAMAMTLLNLPSLADPRFDGMTLELAYPHLNAVPDFTRERGDALLARLPGPLGAEIAARVEVMVEAHLALAELKRLLAARDAASAP